MICSDYGQVSDTALDLTMITDAIASLGLVHKPLCVHSSLRSFGGPVAGGPDGIVAAMLSQGCTVLVPTFSWAAFAIPPPSHLRPARNGCDYTAFDEGPSTLDVYTTESNEIDGDMGALAAAVIARTERARGNHPVNSFTAIGPTARQLVRYQAPLNVYAPLEALAKAGGVVVLMGVGLESMTLLHLAERRAGRVLFRRWARGHDGTPIMVVTGGCSRGFPRLEAVVGPLSRELLVGRSRWWVFPAAPTLEAAARVIQSNPAITRCDDPRCRRCHDAILGGPIL